MKIKVTQQHIDNGIRAVSTRCPIALAVTDSGLIKKPNIVSVGPTYIHELDEQGFKCRVAIVTLKIGDWMDKFDAGKLVKPFEFSMVLS